MVTDWTDINEPMWEVDEFINVVLDKAFILDILDKWGIEYSACRTGDFSQRAKCPFPKHQDGGERTASLFISEEKNSFYCYGCNSGGNIINFVELYIGKPFHEAVKWLAKYAKITENDLENLEDFVRVKRDPEKEIMTHVFRTGIEIRKFLNTAKGKRDYKEWCEWADKRFIKLDKLLTLNDSEWEVAKNYHTKVVNYLKRRQL